MDAEVDEVNSEDGNTPGPIYDSIINAMGPEKEATANQIYRRIQQEGETNYSKPQVDRALANALNYGIFEIHNNRYRMRDDILDDEDTIYCQARMKREKTPYRLENNQRDYINPEKDQHTFRKLYVSDNEGCSSRRKQIANVDTHGGRKGRTYSKKAASASLKNRRGNRCDERVNKAKASKTKKRTPSKRQSMQKKRSSAKKMSKREELMEKNRKKKQKRRGNHFELMNDSDSTIFSRIVAESHRKCGQGRAKYTDNDSDLSEIKNHQDEQELESDAFEQEKPSRPSSYFNYIDQHRGPQFFSKRERINSPCFEDISRPANGSDITGLPNQKKIENRNSVQIITCSNWNLGRSENFQVAATSDRPDWLMNRPENTEDGTVNQYDNTLKFEPLDSLPFRNMEEPSYIS